MPLSDDQKAMLQLVLQHGQSYEDIGALQGLEVREIRSSARAALTELGGQDPDREVGLTDYLLGQADPIGRADVARQLQADSGTRDLAERLAAQLRLIAPGAELPDLRGGGTAAPAKRAPAPASKAASSAVTGPDPATSASTAAPASTGSRLSERLAGRRSQMIAGLAGATALVVVAVLAIAGVFGGGGDSTASDKNSGNGKTQTASNQGPPRAQLDAQDGSDAKGVAVLGQVKRVPTLQVTAFNLAPTKGPESYAIWLRSSQTAIPLGRTKVTKTGRMQVRLPLPSQLLQFIGDRTLTDVDVSLAQDAAFEAEVKRARNSKKLPQFFGKSILSGRIVGSGLNPAGSSGSSG